MSQDILLFLNSSKKTYPSPVKHTLEGFQLFRIFEECIHYWRVETHRFIHHHVVVTPRSIFHRGVDLNWLTKKFAGAKVHQRVKTPTVINSPGSLYSLVYLSPESFFVQLFWYSFQINQEVDSPAYSPHWSQGAPVYSSPGSRFGRRNSFYWFYLGTCDLCLKKLPYPRDSLRLLGVYNQGVKYEYE